MGNGFSITGTDELDVEYNERAGAYNVDLIRELGCTELHPRLWRLSPGETMSYHKHTEQEEFYFVVEGPGRMRIHEDQYDVPEGGAVRVSPDVPRQLFNDSAEEEHVWLVVAAPARRKDGIHL